jgi:NitT/TauT family transport system ATP-binding protein
LDVDHVSRRFANGTVALDDVSLTVGERDFIALLGPSGCGKSTLLRLIAALDQPDQGQIRWNGPPPPLGFVFQEPTLLPWASALDNVRLPLRLQGTDGRDAARTALARVGLAGFEAARPRQLSGGMRMRVSLARAFITEPRLLLLDEPFAALDEFTRHGLQDDLRQLWRTDGGSVIFVTHSIYEAAYLARRVVIMSPRPGRIAAEIESPLGDDEDRRLSPAYAELVAEITRALRAVHAA